MLFIHLGSWVSGSQFWCGSTDMWSQNGPKRYLKGPKQDNVTGLNCKKDSIQAYLVLLIIRDVDRCEG